MTFIYKNTANLRVGVNLERDIKTSVTDSKIPYKLTVEFRRLDDNELYTTDPIHFEVKVLNTKNQVVLSDATGQANRAGHETATVTFLMSELVRQNITNTSFEDISFIEVLVNSIGAEGEEVTLEYPNFVTFDLRNENLVEPARNHESDRITTSYCTVGDVSDWLRVDINANSNPNTKMIEKMILRNEDEIDRRTGHTWRTVQFSNETIDLNYLYDAGRGMAIFVKHRMIKPFDTSKGDKIEIWDGLRYVDYAIPPSAAVTVEPTQGIIYFRGFIFTLLRKHRFRITYRYGGEQEGTSPVPRDIEKACLLMTAIDVLSTDFKYSSLAYGGEGNVRKGEIMSTWQDQIDRIISNRQEMTVIF